MAKKQSTISIDPKNKGKFTAFANKTMPGKSVCSVANAVMKNKGKYSASRVKQANFAKNFGCKK